MISTAEMGIDRGGGGAETLSGMEPEEQPAEGRSWSWMTWGEQPKKVSL